MIRSFFRHFLPIAVFGATLPLSVKAAPGDLDMGFVTNIGVGITPNGYPTPALSDGTGAVNAVAVQSTGKILAGGNVSKYNNSGTLSVFKRLNADGTLDNSFNSGGVGFAALAGQAEINSIVVLSDDSILVGGLFDSYNGTTVRGIVKLTAEGAIHPNFTATGTNTTGNRYVMVMHVLNDGSILVGGGFNTFNGSSRLNLAKLSPTGALESFSNNSLGSSSILDIDTTPDGMIYVSGTMGTSAFLRRLYANGTVDGSFLPQFGSNSGNIAAILPLADGTILAGGFPTLASAGYNDYLVAFNADGSVNTTFMSNMGAGPNGYAGYDLVQSPDGKIIVASRFSAISGQPRSAIARLNPNGTLDPTFAPPPYTNTGFGTHFYAAAVQADGKIVGGGWFDRVSDPDLVTVNLTRFEGDVVTGPGSLRLAAAVVSGAEGANLQIAVHRFGGSSGAVSVTYGTGGGTATAGNDYTAASGTLNWAAGEMAPKFITIPLLQDLVNEGNETFTLTLSGPTGGATIQAGSGTATITILDDDNDPGITQHPVSQSVYASLSVTFRARALHALPVTYQWYKGDTPISGATEASYTRNNLSPTDAGDYKVRVSVYDPQTSSTRFIDSNVAALTVVEPPGSLDVSFPATAGVGFNTTVNDILHLPDGSTIFVGNFSSYNGVSTPQPYLARLNANGSLNTSWPVSGSGANSYISDIARYPDGVGHDGKFIVVGSFTSQSGTSMNRVARLNADGTLDATFASVGIGNNANKVLILPDGSVLVAAFQNGITKYGLTGGAATASFQPHGGSSTVGYGMTLLPDGNVLVAAGRSTNPRTTSIYRVNANLVQDLTFNLQSFNDYIQTIAVDAQGRIYAGGNYSVVNGTLNTRLVRLLPNGDLDSSFTSPLLDGAVLALHMQADGRLVVGGGFANVGGLLQRGLTRLLPSGERDVTFFVGSGIEASQATTSIAPDAQGRLFIGGSFGNFAGTTRGRFARLNGDFGTVQFANANILVNEQAGTVTLTVQRLVGTRDAVSVNYTISNGTAIAGADFTGTLSGTLNWAAGDGADKQLVFNLINDGLAEGEETFTATLSNPTNLSTLGEYASTTVTILDDEAVATILQHPQPVTVPEANAASFSVTVRSATAVSYQWLKNGANIPSATSSSYTIPTVALTDTNNYSVRITNAAGSIVSMAADLTVLISPTAKHSTWTTANAITGGAVRTILPLPDGGALVGGDFTTPQRGLMRLTASGAQDPSFTLALANVSGFGIYDLVRDAQGRIYVAGRFDVIGGKSYRNLVRLKSDLTIDDDFATMLGSGPSGRVRCVTVLENGQIMFGGQFDSVSSVPGTMHFARLFDHGEVDRSLVSYITRTASGSSMEVYRIRQMPGDSRVYVGGSLTSYFSNNYLVRILPDGVRDSTFSAGVSGRVHDFLIRPDGRLLVGGQTQSGSLPYVEQLAATGVRDTVYLGGGSYTGTAIHSLSLQANGKLIVGGTYTVVGGVAQNRFTRLMPNGAVDTTLNLQAGFNSDVYTTVLAPDGRIWVGGSFTQYRGATANYITRLYGDDAVVGIGQAPVSQKVQAGNTAQFSIVATGSGPFSYEWRKNGVLLSNGGNITGATASTLSISNAQAADEASYSVRLFSDTSEVLSPPASLQVAGAPVIVSASTGGSFGVGKRRILSIQVKAADPYSIQWFKGSTLIPGATGPAYLLPTPTTGDSGDYEAVVTNSLNTATTGPLTHQFVSPDPAGIFAAPLSSVGNSSSVILPLPDGRFFLGWGQSTLRVYNQAGVQTTIPAFNNNVNWVIRQKNGGYLVAGSFTQVGGVSTPGLARLRPDLTHDTTFRANLGAFNSSSLSISRVLELPNGRILVGGAFLDLNGEANTRTLVMLREDGSRDTSFTSRFTQSFATTVAGLAYDAVDNTLLVCGTSDMNYGGVTARLHRLRLDGSRLPGLNVTFANTASTMLLQPDRRILIGGVFDSVQSVTDKRAIVRLNPDGTIDNTFNAVGGYSGNNFNIGPVRALALEADGQILAVGDYPAINGRGANNLVRLNADGTLDELFNPGLGMQGSGSRVESVAVSADGKIYLTGSMQTYNGTTINDVVILNGDPIPLAFASEPSDQYVEPGNTLTLTAAGVGTTAVSYQWYHNGTPLSDGAGVSGSTTATLTITGVNAGRAGSYTVRITNTSGFLERMAAVTVLGAPQIVEQPLSGSYFIGSNVTLTVRAIGVPTLTYQWYKGTDPISGATSSSLTLTNTQKADSGSYSVRISNGSGTVTSNAASLVIFLPPAGFKAGFPVTAGANQAIRHIIPLGDGRALIGGSFNSAGATGSNTSVSNLALMKADGTIDTAFMPQPNSQVTALARDENGKVYVSGYFNTIGGASRSNLARLNTDGTADTAYHTAMGTGPNSAPSSIIPLSDGRVLISGSFNNISGTPRVGVARLNVNGSLDAGFIPLTSGNVQSMALQSDGKIIISGYFTISGRQNLARLNADGTLDTTFSAILNSPASAIAIQSNGQIVLGGGFTSYNGNTVGSLIRVSSTGVLDAAFPAGGAMSSPSTVNSLLVQPNGRIVVGGGFMTYSGSGLGLVRLEADGNLDTTFVTGLGWSYTGSYALALESDGTIWAGGASPQFNSQTVNYLVVFNGDEPVLTPTFAQWVTTSGIPVGEQDAEDDPDQDGVNNLLEYALGFDPINAASGHMPEAIEDGATVTLTYTRVRANVTYTVLATDDLANPASWSPVGVNQGTPDGNGVTTASIPLAGPRRFMKLHVSQ